MTYRSKWRPAIRPRSTRTEPWIALAALLLATGCPASRPAAVPPSEPAVISDTQPGAASSSIDREAGTRLLSDPRGADGAPCAGPEDCLSGVCEGEGCEGESPGTCVPAERPCSADKILYCGCDGETFAASSTCPGEVFASRGECEETGAP